MLLKKYLPVFAVVAGLLAAAVFFYGRPQEAAGNYDDFASCLGSSGAVMYGADWYPHCLNEKNAFGDSFKFVNYVECPRDPERCIAEGIKGYPTWVFPDGRRFEGEMGLEKLSEESGCLLENKK